MSTWSFLASGWYDHTISVQEIGNILGAPFTEVAELKAWPSGIGEQWEPHIASCPHLGILQCKCFSLQYSV